VDIIQLFAAIITSTVVKINRGPEVPLLGQLGTVDIYRGMWDPPVRKLRGDLIAAFQCLKGAFKKDGE